MKNRQEKLEAVRAACVKANPDIVVDEIGHENGEQAPEIERVYREVRLADVLLAIQEESGAHALPSEEDGGSTESMKYNAQVWRDRRWSETLYGWNLRRDDLTEQSDECIDFLYQLLK